MTKMLYTINCLTIILCSCNSAKKLANVTVTKPDVQETIAPLQQSYSTIPVSVPLQSLYDQIKEGLNNFELDNYDWNGDKGGSCNDRGWTHIKDDKFEKHQIFLDYINLQNPSENVIVISLKIHYVVWGRDNSIFGCSSGNCDNDGLYELAFDIKVTVPNLENINGSVSIENFNKFDRDCDISVFNHSATDDLICSISKSVHTSLDKVLTKDFLINTISNYASKIPSSFDITVDKNFPKLNILPILNNLTISKLKIIGNELKFNVGIYNSTIVKTQDIKTLIPIEQPNSNSKIEISDENVGVNLNAGLLVSYSAIETSIKNLLLQNLRIHPKKGIAKIIDFKISEMKVTGDVKGNLNIKVETKGFPNATLNLKCYPSYNSISNTIVLNKISYSLKTKNVIVHLVKPFYNKAISKAITNNSTIAVNSYISNYTNKLNKLINGLNIKNIANPAIGQSTIRVTSIKSQPDFLIIYCNLTGDPLVNINTKNIKIPLPKSPYRPKPSAPCGE